MSPSSDNQGIHLARQLKAAGRRAVGSERRRLFGKAAAAYEAAAASDAATYPLINAATLWRMAGETGKSRALAARVLAALDSGRHDPDTPWWLGATRSEALLLMGRPSEAREVLANAAMLAPHAWEDHATTVRQLEMLLTETGTDMSWLDAFRPPGSLYYSGIIGIDADDSDAAEGIDNVIVVSRAGFGFGALAAGADILAAEALSARGASLHVVLPCDPQRFLELSVEPYGNAWSRRFESLCAKAEVLEWLESSDGISVAAIALADLIAMGLALTNARRMQSTASALLVSDAGQPADTIQARARWKQSGAPMTIIDLQPVRALRLTDVGRFRCIAAVATSAGTSQIRFGDRVDDAIGIADAAVADRITAAGIAYGLVGGDGDAEALAQVALALARVAAPGRIVVERTAMLALAVSAPDRECDPIGELDTPQGPMDLYELHRVD
jgi:hypothetical protein